ncbi:MAG: hypothetical protein M0R77_19185 [Gammaproteobacteria bacterium]|nr:hypothetical protein [Gammaproteobacteria bacterium]
MAYKIKPFADSEIEVYFSRDKYRRFLKKHEHDNESLDNLAGQSIWLEHGATYRHVFAIGIFEDIADTCIHEAVHAVDNIMERYNIHDREFKAYMTGYISCELFNLCKKVFVDGN